MGDRLGVPPKYYQSACDCIAEISVKLTQVVWRKLLPEDLEAADVSLINTTFELLLHENFTLAHELLRFANGILKKHASERNRLILLVNWAQACKWMNNDSECQELLNKEDWSAKGSEFRLCVAVLREKYEEAVVAMKEIGNDGAIRAQDYREWPMFRKAREDVRFQDGYKEVFGEEMKRGRECVDVESG